VAHWQVKMKETAELELLKLLKMQLLTKDDIKVLLRWVSEMEEFGPDYIARSAEWRDHPLEREWKGHRSSAFSYAGRVIYKIIDDLIIVEVAKVTTDHDYRR
jgi:mRNA-degrading endonuclease YafQ of YafQ-DinJ toxin-antitoxin module